VLLKMRRRHEIYALNALMSREATFAC